MVAPWDGDVVAALLMVAEVVGAWIVVITVDRGEDAPK